MPASITSSNANKLPGWHQVGGAPHSVEVHWTDKGRVPGSSTAHTVSVDFDRFPGSSFVLDANRFLGTTLTTSGPGMIDPDRDRDIAQTLHDAVAAADVPTNKPDGEFAGGNMPAGRVAFELGTARYENGPFRFVDKRRFDFDLDNMPKQFSAVLDAVQGYRQAALDRFTD